MRGVLRARTSFSLGIGVAGPEGMCAAALDAGLEALAIADVDMMAALPRAVVRCPPGLKLVAGVEVNWARLGRALVFPTDRKACAELAAWLAAHGGPTSHAPRPLPGREAGAGWLVVALDPVGLPALAEHFADRVWAGAAWAVTGRRAATARRRMLAAATAARVPVVVADEVRCATDADRAAAHVLGPEADAPLTLERMAGLKLLGEGHTAARQTEALLARLPHARDLLAPVAAGDDATALADDLVRAGHALGIRTLRQPSPSAAHAELLIEPHAGPTLAARVLETLERGWLGRASEVRTRGIADACRLLGRALGLAAGAAHRLQKAAESEPERAQGPSAAALAFAGLDPSAPAVARAASLVPVLAALPAALVPGRSLVRGGEDEGPPVPMVGASPVPVLCAEAEGLRMLGYATVALRADAMTGVLGELARLGAPVIESGAEPANENGLRWHEGLALAHAEAMNPAAVLCARLRSSPGLSVRDIARLVAGARRRGVHIRPARLDRGGWLATLERDGVRLGLSSVLGPSTELRAACERALAAGPPRTLAEFARLSGLPPAALDRLAAANALRPYAHTRDEALRKVALLRAPAGSELDLAL